MAIIMRYGSQGDSTAGQGNAIIASGLIEDGTPVVLDVFEAGGVYELVTSAYNRTTSVFRGMTKTLISAPEAAQFGTVALNHTTEAATSNTGMTLTWNADSTLTISQSTYAVRYILRDLSI